MKDCAEIKKIRDMFADSRLHTINSPDRRTELKDLYTVEEYRAYKMNLDDYTKLAWWIDVRN